MKIIEIKTHEFKTTTLQYDRKYGFWIYPIEMLQKGLSETTTTLLELVTDTGTGILRHLIELILRNVTGMELFGIVFGRVEAVSSI